MTTLAEKNEYAMCVDLLKHYATIQFAQFSVFVAFMTASVAFLSRSEAVGPSLSTWIDFGILAVAIGFLVMNASHACIVSVLLSRAVRLEEELGYEALGKVPCIRSSWARPTSVALVVVSLLFVVFAFLNCAGCISKGLK
jgi:NADH:ubiquinone oxidoreductase subunit 3 (subunit A)